ncbi:glycosyltransferase [Algicella marina]|uniref:Glycosyltransferase n=1 Tax=Algicella marina TaxID=2683284 RepID=A0A6P1SXY0_9RHOB|nr:glycosyltransferase family 2 protein [Algicella marina]QHQ34076.1 glycosyltransferase [Algicella marina]
MTVAAVAIGRNEGERLERCLASMQGVADVLVYVDSGSKDGSVAAARAAGAEVVELDMSQPFTAARARNAGFEALAERGMAVDFVQFVDGDCALVEGWLPAARAALEADEGLGIVTGWRSEIHRDASIYNQLCDFEWRRPAGPILTCGGDMMVRRLAFEQAGGFDPTVIAAEDDEFCVRIRGKGWKMERLPLEMTRHDAAMTGFGQWWQRAVRSGHGFAQVGWLHPEYFVKERKRVWFYGFVLPVIAVLGLLLVSILVPLLVLGVYGLNWWRTSKGLVREGLPAAEARRHAVLITLSKIPNMLGMLTFHWRRFRGSAMRIIEYK